MNERGERLQRVALSGSRYFSRQSALHQLRNHSRLNYRPAFAYAVDGEINDVARHIKALLFVFLVRVVRFSH